MENRRNHDQMTEKTGRFGDRGKRKAARRVLCIFLSALLVFLSLSFTPGFLDVTAARAEDGVFYIDAHGNSKTQDGVAVLNGGTSSWTGWYMVTGDLSIGSRITVSGTAHLILCDGAKLTASSGITVNAGNTLTIYGQQEGTGQLVSQGDKYNAGIGSEKKKASGTITINGGSVTATGGQFSAGIGGGQQGTGGAITINAGTVAAFGGKSSAGIGGGSGGSGGTIMISGGTVTANGGSRGAGIGGGKSSGTGGTISISGGTVKAAGGTSGAGIGGGSSGVGGDITISGGTVTANGGASGAGIGGGNAGGTGGTIGISGGSVTATGGASGAGIGGGKSGAGGDITISGGTVTATGGKWSAGIGGGSAGVSGAISISGGTVTATGGTSGAGIGGGINGEGSTITISDGTVTANGGIDGAGIGGGEGKKGNGGYITISGGTVVATSGTKYAEAIGRGRKGTSSGTLNLKQMHVTAGSDASSAAGITGSGWATACRNRYARLEPCEDHQYDENGICVNCGEGGLQEEMPTITWKTPDGSIRSTDHWARVTDSMTGLNGLTESWYAVTEDVTLSSRLEITGTVNLILCDGITLHANKGIHLPGGSALTIWAQDEGTGKLMSEGNSIEVKNQAAIGGNNGESSGTLTVNGGTINANGGIYSAGIGGGFQGGGGKTTINAGRVDAKSGKQGAGIGGGYKGAAGTITINGGTVNAEGDTRLLVTGIGSGYLGGTGIITINNGTVNTKGTIGISCGGTQNSKSFITGGEITINGGKVTATGGKVGIGSGTNCSGSRITINGGTVNANGGIGNRTSASTIIINDGNINANGDNNVGIGGSESTIMINGGTIQATGGKNHAGIGGPKDSNGGTITITGGKVTARSLKEGAGIGNGKTTRLKYHPWTIIIRGGQITAEHEDKGYDIGSKVKKGYDGLVVLDWTKQTDFINAWNIVGSEYRIEKPFHYETPEGVNMGPVTADNLRGKDNNYRLVPDQRDEAEVVIPEGDQKLSPDGSCVLTAVATCPGTAGTGVWTWHSDDPQIARIEETDGTITVQAVSLGTTRISASYLSDSTMGEASVTVTVAVPHEITIADSEHGTVTADHDTALPGDPVTLTVQPDQNYRLGSMIVTGGEEVIETTLTEGSAEVGESTWTFIMPDNDVSVSAAFCRSNLISFVNYDGTVLQQAEMDENETPVYNGETPTRKADEEYSYTFAGWDPEITAVTGSAIYTATYTGTTRSYQITFADEDGTELQSSEVEYGEIPEYEGIIPTRAGDEQGKFYAFSNWTPEIEPVSGVATYTAEYAEVTSLQTGESTLSLRAWQPATFSFVPDRDDNYRFHSDATEMFVKLRIYDGEGMEAEASDSMPWESGYVFDCVAELKAGKTYYAEFMAYNGDEEVTLHIDTPAIYTIRTGTTEHGRIVYCDSTAYAGKKIDIQAEPDPGYEWSEIIISDEDGKVLATDIGYVMPDMPAANIVIDVTFKKLNRMLFKLDDQISEPLVVANGQFWNWEDAKASEGSHVNMALFCETSEYAIDSVTVTTESGDAIPCYLDDDDESEYISFYDEDDSVGLYWFDMPDEPVLIRVTRTLNEEEPGPEPGPEPEAEPEPEFDGATFTLPADIQEIGENAFEGDKSIFVVDIPEGCRRIGNGAFRGCRNLWKVRIPADCAIGEDAFDNCGSVYIFGMFDSPAYYYCLEHQNCGFIELEPAGE